MPFVSVLSIPIDSAIILTNVTAREIQPKMSSPLASIISAKVYVFVHVFARALFCVLLCVGLLSACVSARVLENWPPQLPEQHHFLSYYAEDADNQKVQTELEYLTWVLRFYEGWELMPTGWQDIEASMLFGLSEQDHALVETQMLELGALMSAEWAKDNSVRLLDSAILSLWGAVMQADFAPEARIAAVTQIHEDVRGLLEGTLTLPSINEQRYFDTLGVLLEP